MGANTIRITLNTNNHLSYVFNGAAIEKNVEIVVEKNIENISKINLTEKEWSKAILPKVKIEVVEDKMKGWNLQIKKLFSYLTRLQKIQKLCLILLPKLLIQKI